MNEQADAKKQTVLAFYSRAAPFYDESPSFHIAGRRLAEIAGPMVEATAAEITRRNLLNAEVLEMDAENLEFPDSTFDHVLAGFVLNFIPDLGSALAEIRRCYGLPGGLPRVPGGHMVNSQCTLNWRRLTVLSHSTSTAKP